jgi:hypothetical protein
MKPSRTSLLARNSSCGVSLGVARRDRLRHGSARRGSHVGGVEDLAADCARIGHRAVLVP